MKITRRIYLRETSSGNRTLVRDRRAGQLRKGGKMRRITHWHRTLTVLAVGLLALAAPLVAYADATPSGH